MTYLITNIYCAVTMGYIYIILSTLHAAAQSLQLCPTLCDPIDGSPPGSPVPGILQARTLEWVAISFPMHESEKWKWSHSVMFDSSQPHGTTAYQAPPSMGFSRQENWSGVPSTLHRFTLSNFIIILCDSKITIHLLTEQKLRHRS